MALVADRPCLAFSAKLDSCLFIPFSFQENLIHLALDSQSWQINQMYKFQWTKMAGIVISTLLFMLSWQFAQFVLLMQTCALLGAFLFGYLHIAALKHIILSILCAVYINIVLSFGSWMRVGLKSQENDVDLS